MPPPPIHGLSPDLRNLIDAIEAWPSTMSSYQKAQPKRVHQTEGGEGDGDDDEDDEAALAPSLRMPAPAPALKLTTSLRAPVSRRMSSMVSGVPQRDEEWRRSALGPALGPGSYATTVEALNVREPTRQSQNFRSDVNQRPPRVGLVGEPNAPEGMYAHSSMPHKPYPLVPSSAIATFKSVGYRFGADGYLKSVLQTPTPVRRRATASVPQWHGLQVPSDHAERLAAARASLGS